MKNILKTVCCGVLTVFSAATIAETIAFREDTSLYVVPNLSRDTSIYIDKVTDSYKVGEEFVAYIKNNKYLYVASEESQWRGVFVSNKIRDYKVTEENVIFRHDDGNIYLVTDFTVPKSFRPVGYNIRDYKTLYSDRRTIRN